jgi:hypothetical protein
MKAVRARGSMAQLYVVAEVLNISKAFFVPYHSRLLISAMSKAAFL